MKKVTIKDVAAKANVAPSTVSNALNPDSKKISNKKRKYILEIISQMGYVPDFSAQKIASKNNRRIGFFIRTSGNKSASQISEQLIHYMNKQAFENNLDLVNIIIPSNIENYADEVLYRINTYDITDLIIYGLNIDFEMISALNKLKINKIFIEIATNGDLSHFISVDNYSIQLNMVKKICAENNISKMLYITGDLDSQVGLERYNAIKHYKNNNIIQVDTLESRFDTDYTYNIIKNMDLECYDFICCGSDDMLLAVIKYLNKKNYTPILSGFDNSFVLNDTNFTIYTVEQNICNLTLIIIEMFLNQDYYSVLIEGEIVKK